jgi:hypothetical protein
MGLITLSSRERRAAPTFPGGRRTARSVPVRASEMTRTPDGVTTNGRDPRPTAYSLLEVQVAMILLTAGLMGIAGALRVHSRQLEVAEAWCREGVEYYVVSQSNTWMRRLGVPAELTTEPGVSAWEPPVTGEQNYEVELDSFALDPDTRSATARVNLRKIK